jgi:hypothetical protein
MKQEFFAVTTKLELDLGGLQKKKKNTNIPDGK